MPFAFLISISTFNEKALVKILKWDGDFVTTSFKHNGYSYPLVMPKVGFGTGILLSEDGLILTAKHVVEGARFITVAVPDYSLKYFAEVVYEDPEDDFAFIVVKGKFKNYILLPDKPPKIRRKMKIQAWGYPLVAKELEPSVTQGIVSRWSSTYKMWQTDAPLNPGNSGGPILDENDRIIGIVVAKIEGAEGMGYFIPLDRIINLLEELKASGRIENVRKSFDLMDPEVRKLKDDLAEFLYDISTGEENVFEEAYLKKMVNKVQDYVSIDTTKLKSKDLANVYALLSAYFFDLGMAYIASKGYPPDAIGKMGKEDVETFSRLIAASLILANMAIEKDPSIKGSEYISIMKNFYDKIAQSTTSDATYRSSFGFGPRNFSFALVSKIWLYDLVKPQEDGYGFKYDIKGQAPFTKWDLWISYIMGEWFTFHLILGTEGNYSFYTQTSYDTSFGYYVDTTVDTVIKLRTTFSPGFGIDVASLAGLYVYPFNHRFVKFRLGSHVPNIVKSDRVWAWAYYLDVNLHKGVFFMPVSTGVGAVMTRLGFPLWIVVGSDNVWPFDIGAVQVYFGVLYRRW